MKILLAADGSAYTRRAVNYLCKHLRTLGPDLEIHLLHIRPPLPGRATAAVSASAPRAFYAEESGKALAPAVRAFNRLRVRHKAVNLIGDLGRAICEYAKKGEFNLVVMGSHGNDALLNLVLGSVVSKVLANCDVPALIVR